MKKYISIFLSISLILSSFILAFADDQEPDSSGSGSSASDVVTLEPISSVDNDVLEVDNKLRELASIMATNSTYDANDIYVLLVSVISGNKVQVLDSSVLSKLGQIYDALYTGNGTSGYPIASYLADAIGYNANSSDDIMTLLSQISLSLGGYVVSSSAEGVWGYIVTIKGVLDDIYDSLGGSGNIGGLLGTIDTGITNLNTKLQTVNTNLGSILGMQTTINNSLSTIHSDLTTSNSSLSHIDSDLHDLKQWLNDTFYFEYQSDNSYILESFYIPSLPYFGNYGENVNSSLYFLYPILPTSFLKTLDSLVFDVTFISDGSFSYPSNNSSNNWYESFSIYGLNSIGSTPSSKLSTNSYVRLYYDIIDSHTVVFHYDFSSISSYLDSYPFIFPYGYASYPGAGLVFSPSPNYLSASVVSIISVNGNYLSHIDSDLHSQLDILNRFKDLYASDDLVSAKEEQQTFEDTALEDFTGEGSAAASVNDLGSLKNISTTVKSGLTTGKSVSDGLSIFNTNSGFWDFFCQDNYNTLNNLSTGGTNLRKGSSDIPTPYYDENMRLLTDEWHDYNE